jgi:hypothetical protein
MMLFSINPLVREVLLRDLAISGILYVHQSTR